MGSEFQAKREFEIMAACVREISRAEHDPDAMRRIMGYLIARFPEPYRAVSVYLPMLDSLGTYGRPVAGTGEVET